VTAVTGRPNPEIFPLPRRFWVNTLAQGVLRQFTQWPLTLEVLIVNLGGSARLLPLLLKSVTTFLNDVV